MLYLSSTTEKQTVTSVRVRRFGRAWEWKESILLQSKVIAKVYCGLTEWVREKRRKKSPGFNFHGIKLRRATISRSSISIESDNWNNMKKKKFHHSLRVRNLSQCIDNTNHTRHDENATSGSLFLSTQQKLSHSELSLLIAFMDKSRTMHSS